MDDAEDIQSAWGDMILRARRAIGSNDTDLSSERMADQMMDVLLKFEDDVDPSDVLLCRWYFETCAWLLFNLNIPKDNIPEISFPVKSDDRLRGLACYAARMSIELVMKNLYLSRTFRYRGAKRTIKYIHKAVLGRFDLFCKNLLIEKSWDAINLKDSITKAADLATDYLNSKGDQMQFPADDKHDHFILWNLQATLTGNFENEELFSQMQPSTIVVDDHLVGLGGDLMKIKERLTGFPSKLDIIPIIGMGGIGKTTLTRSAYEEPQIMLHFHVRAWIMVSQEFRARDVLLGLLQSIALVPNEVCKEDEEQLAERLYRRLKGWRYFIVIDDIWTTEAWDRIKLCFPDDNNGSRIVLTSRIAEVAYYVSPENSPHFMNFLGLEDSWELLRKQVCGKEACPPQLVNVGMQIAEKCQGLPLAIEVLAGHLSNISKTQECWEDVAKRVGLPTEVTQMESLSSILSISYSELPHHLKACFLSMVTFPKNSEISVGKLIRLWTAMGFLPRKLPNRVEKVTMEEVAMKCFEDLIGRNLIMVRKKKFDGKVKLCCIHDLLWDLSMREARKEGHHIFGNTSLCNADYVSSCDDVIYAMGISRALLYFDRSFESDYPLNSEGFKVLWVLDILNQSFDHFPIEITGLVNLRYLALATSGNIPDLVSKLSNLETLINYHERAGQDLPKEIWLLARLRHLHVGNCTYLAEPPNAGFEGSSVSGLPNLQSLSNLSCASCTKEVLLNIPNLKQLEINEAGEEDIEDDLLFSSLHNLVYLDQLEILKLCCNPKVGRPWRIANWGSFLPSIKQLTLIGSNLPGSEMNALAMLPNLEVLKLKRNALKGDEWEMDDEEFLQLKYLLLESKDLISWKASSHNFPNLQCLVLRDCRSLCRLPVDFGDIITLQLIDVECCSPYTYESAVAIQREQMNLGNDKFILRLGRALPQYQLLGLVAAFVWLALRLKMLKA